MGISREQALDCFQSDDLIGIGMEADAVRRRLHPESVVSYSIDRPIDLSTSTYETIFAQIDAALSHGATGVLLQGVATQTLEQLEDRFRAIHHRFPTVRVRALSAAEIVALAESSHLPIADALTRLKAAGLDALPGDGAETLGLARWLEAHRAAHLAGIPTTATLRFGAGESLADRVAFLEAVRALQEKTSGFIAFTLASHHAPGGRDLDDATAVEFLKTLAICRMVLDNIPHVQTNWEQQGLKVLQMGLRFGGNDIGSILAATAAAEANASEEEIRRLIRDAGFKPVQRDTLYRTHFLN